MGKKSKQKLLQQLEEIAAALTRLAPPDDIQNDLAACDCFVWEPEQKFLQPIINVNRVELKVLRGIDHVRDILIDNTKRFAANKAANNALLWGARGQGKSSLVKAVHAEIASRDGQLKLR